MTPKAYSRAEVVSSGQITLSDPSVLQHTEDALRHRREIFPKGARIVAEHAVNTSAELLAASKTVPEDIHALITELIAMTMEYAEQEYVVNGDKLWEFQRALGTEFIQILASMQPREQKYLSCLLEETPGLGKTRIMWIIIAALTRLQAKGVMNGNILILIKRRSLVSQQALGKSAQREAVDSTDERSIREVGVFLRPLLGDDPFSRLSKASCRNLFRKQFVDLAAAEATVRELFEANGLTEHVTSTHGGDGYLLSIAKMLVGQGTLIMGPNRKDMEFLELSPVDPDASSKSDFLFGVPEKFWEDNQVFIQTELDFDNAAEEERPGADTRVAVLSVTSLAQDRSRQKLKKFLEKVEWIFVDEAGLRSDHEYQNIVTHVGGEPPHVLAATAFRRHGRANYQRHFSTVSPRQGVNSPDHPLKQQRLDVFPGEGEPLYPSGSIEAFEQFLVHYRMRRDLPGDQGKPQPWEGPHIITVDKRLVAYATMRLREEFGATGMRFISYDANATDERYSARIQARMNDPVHDQTCLIASPQSVMDSFDWPRLRSTSIAVHDKDRSCETLARLGGRQLHTRQPDGGYLIQQRFADAPSRNNTLWDLHESDAQISQKGVFPLTPGEVFFGQDARESDEAFMADRPPYSTRPIAVHLSGKEHVKRNLQKGNFLPHLNKQSPFPAACVFPPCNEGETPEEYAVRFAAVNGLENYLSDVQESAEGCATPDALYAALTRSAQRCACRILCGGDAQLAVPDPVVLTAPAPAVPKAPPKKEKPRSPVDDIVRHVVRKVCGGDARRVLQNYGSFLRCDAHAEIEMGGDTKAVRSSLRLTLRTLLSGKGIDKRSLAAELASANPPDTE